MALSFATFASAQEQQEKLACMAGASADIDGSKSYSTDASGIRFLLTLYKTNGAITSMHLKHSGTLEGMPTIAFECFGTSDLYSCSNLSNTVWYYTSKKHGVYANLGLHTIFKEKRANSAGIYNYSCSSF